ncbi:cellulase [Streptomyces sp. NPDC059781]|uniref:cellulase n=1 Tax=Streptomyces sp. NPDC059781 TaxID=3346943 RepID=UPI003646E7C4
MDDFERELTRMMRDTRQPAPFRSEHQERLYEGIRVRRRARLLWRAGGSALAVAGLSVGLALLPGADSRSLPADRGPLPATGPTPPPVSPVPTTSAPDTEPSVSRPPTNTPGTTDTGTTSPGYGGTPTFFPSSTAPGTTGRATTAPSPPVSTAPPTAPPSTPPARGPSASAGEESAGSG